MTGDEITPVAGGASHRQSSARAGRSSWSPASRAAGIELPTDVLDRIDQIIAPGGTVNPDDNSCGAHELTAAARHR